jgi:hypothetical protein
MRTLPIFFAFALSVSTPLGAQTKEKIQKCQDAEGRWHYGQHAAAECAPDKTITTIDDRGQKRREQRPPPTVEELQARKEEEARKQEAGRQAAAARAADSKLLNSYDSEEALIQARDSQLNSLDAVIRGNRKLLESRRAQRLTLATQLAALKGTDAETAIKRLDAIQAEIAEFEAATVSRENDRARIVQRFETELERYRELKNRMATPR